MQNKTILESVLLDVEQINWTSNNVKLKAANFVADLFNIFSYKYKSFDVFMPMSKEYWFKLIKGSDRHINEIKRHLTSNKILDVKTGLYNKDKRVLSYKFNQSYINNYSINSHIIIIATSFCNELENNELESIENTTKNILKRLKIDETSNDVVSKIVLQEVNKIKEFDLSKTIESFIEINLDGKTYRYSVENAVKLSNTLNKKLVKYKTKYYITDSIEEFKKYKTNELSILYTKQLFDIENGIVYASRNKTNNRLDSNVTNLKSELWSVLRLDNEEFDEIDISNAQFAIAANIIECDELFKELSINGNLYKYVASQLAITQKEAKSLMFRVAFDKVKKDHDSIRNMFPIFMNTVDTYKKQNGYDMFSNLLQKEESNIMIDNVLFTLLKEGFDVLSVHDSIRCKKSDYDKVLNRINEIFTKINFKCTLKNKNTNTLEVKEDALEETKTSSEEVYVATKEDYIIQLKKWYANIKGLRYFRENEEKILNELVSKQVNKKQDIIQIVTKYSI